MLWRMHIWKCAVKYLHFYVCKPWSMWTLKYSNFELCSLRHAYFNKYFKVCILRSVNTLKWRYFNVGFKVCILWSMRTKKCAYYNIRDKSYCFHCVGWSLLSDELLEGDKDTTVDATMYQKSKCTLNSRGVASDPSILPSSGHTKQDNSLRSQGPMDERRSNLSGGIAVFGTTWLYWSMERFCVRTARCVTNL